MSDEALSIVAMPLHHPFLDECSKAQRGSLEDDVRREVRSGTIKADMR